MDIAKALEEKKMETKKLIAAMHHIVPEPAELNFNKTGFIQKPKRDIENVGVCADLTDHVMDHVMDAGGLVCCYLLTFGLKSRNGSSLDIINRHITAMCGLRGVNYVGIGTDGCATGYPSREVWSQFFYILKDKLDPDGTFGARFPDQPDTPPGMLTPQRLVTLHNHLAEVCGPDNADKIMGDNAIRFLRSALPQAA